MSTRGYVGYRKGKNKAILYYNHSDSYPSGLFRWIVESGFDLKEWENEEAVEETIEFEKVLDGLPFRTDEDDEKYLFIEYVYVVDKKERKLWCFEHVSVPALPENKPAWRLFAVVDFDVAKKLIEYIDDIEEAVYNREYGGFKEFFEESFGTLEITKSDFDENKLKKTLMLEKMGGGKIEN